MLLGYVADRGTADAAGVVTSVNAVKGSVDGLAAGLSDVSIGTSSGSVEPVDDKLVGYGEEPTDDNLPTDDAVQSSFGTLLHDDDSDDYRNQAKTALSGMVPSLSSSSCQVSFSIPYPTLSGIAWHYSGLYFCPYESYLSTFGSALVFLSALYELFKLA